MGLKSITATSLKDEARVAGLVLPVGHVVTVDLSDEQVVDVQSAVDRGDVSVSGMSATAPKGKGK